VEYFLKDEKDFLTKIQANDNGEGLDFVHVGEFELFEEGNHPEDTYSCTKEELYLIQQLEQRGFVDRRWETKEGFNVGLTPLGHDQIEWHRSNTFFRKGFRWLGSWADKVLASIVTPILVSILTVLALRYLGLTK